jgi:hypothetical protein
MGFEFFDGADRRQVPAMSALSGSPMGELPMSPGLAPEMQSLMDMGRQFAGLVSQGPEAMQQALTQLLSAFGLDGDRVDAFMQGLGQALTSLGYLVSRGGSGQNLFDQSMSFSRPGDPYATNISFDGALQGGRFNPSVNVEQVPNQG